MSKNNSDLFHHLFSVFIALLVLLALGVWGYRQLEGWSWLDALYMTFISMSTVGYREVAPLSPAGRIFTMVVILLGMVVISMLSASVTSWFVRNELLAKRKLNKMHRKINKLQNHIIICGGGDTGQTIMHEFIQAKKSFVVIEEKPSVAAELRERFADYYFIQGSATKDETLIDANISQAAGLITAIPNDADNLFVVVSARTLNPQMTIISRAVDPNTESKLYNAGADYVISPKMVEGLRMASVILRPTVINFLEVMMDGKGLSLRMEEIKIPEKSSLTGVTLAKAQIPQRTGLIVLAVKRGRDEEWFFNPASSSLLQTGDRLIVLGESEKIDKLNLLIQT